MNKAFLLGTMIIVPFFVFFKNAKSQVLNGVYIAHTTDERKPIPYQFLREADVMWSKMVTRRINLTEKINLPLYYPTEEIEGRKSLIQLIMWGIKNKSLTAFASDDFTTQYSVSEIEERLGAGKDSTEVLDVNGDPTGKYSLFLVKPALSEVKELMVKEMWFFDKQRSVMEVRVVGLCPIRIYQKDVSGTDLDLAGKMTQKLAFWIYYPEARNIFANQPVFNQYNQAEQRSFDDIFFKRIFSGYIFKESNVYNNRSITDYTTGLEVILESERVKEKIFEFEHDLWEF